MKARVKGEYRMKSDKPRCGAKTRSGGTCQKFPLLGGKRCAKHGGGAPQVRRKNKQRLERYAVEKKVAREVQALSVDAIDGVTDPLAELQRLTTEAIHFKDALGGMVNDLEKDISTYSSDGVEHARTVIDLYGAAMDRTAKFLEVAMRHDIAGKLAAIEESKAVAVGAVLMRTLNALNLPPEQIEKAHKIMVAEFRKQELEAADE